MSRCPPPLGPMCWGGRSSICRASSPTVSVLPGQERPCRQKRSISWGAGPPGPGGHCGQHGPRSKGWHGGGDPGVWPEAPGFGGRAGEQHSPVQLLCLGRGRADRCSKEGPVRTVAPPPSSLTPTHTPSCARNGVGGESFCLLSSPAPFLAFLLSCYSGRGPAGAS